MMRVTYGLYPTLPSAEEYDKHLAQLTAKIPLFQQSNQPSSNTSRKRKFDDTDDVLGNKKRKIEKTQQDSTETDIATDMCLDKKDEKASC